jgi:hypothetical protein
MNNMLGKLPLSEIQGPRDDFEIKLAGDAGEIWLNAFKRFLRKENPWAEVINKNLIFVDRTILPKYPDWITEVIYPELQSTGPAELDAGKLKLWLHEKQKNGRIKGNDLQQYLEDRDMLKDCLGLRDLEEIQKKGISFFREYFKGKCIFGWKSVVRSRDGDLHAPCLYEYVGGVCLYWGWLGGGWGSGGPALLLASS